MSATAPVTAQRCEACNAEFLPTRAGHTTCSTRCRVRKHRANNKVSPEERAAIRADVREFLRRTGCGHPLETPPSPEAVLAHILRTAARTGDAADAEDIDDAEDSP